MAKSASDIDEGSGFSPKSQLETMRVSGGRKFGRRFHSREEEEQARQFAPLLRHYWKSIHWMDVEERASYTL